jgi:tRNA nucleotidyltransferase (CCA-adding enzyme)
MLRDPMSTAPKDAGELAQRVEALGLGPLVEAAGETPLYLVGGAVRDLLLGRGRSDVDVAVEGDALALARRLGGDAREHERFGTAKVALDGLEVDLAGTRGERYERPGALPEVRPAPLEEDLARRDFTINAMAVPLAEPGRLIDPHGGRQDLAAGALRVLHPGSFRDDPTRALRAARYAARFGLELEPETERLLREADLRSVSADRLEAELSRLATEEEWRRGFELLSEWGLAMVDDPALMAAAHETLADERWRGVAPLPATALIGGGVSAGDFAAPSGPLREAREIAGAEQGPPSRLAAAARDRGPVAMVLARALGTAWLDDYMDHWRHVRLEIDGQDLLDAGVPQGPAVGRGLSAALAAKLDGSASARVEELAVALEAARGEGEGEGPPE